jgi:hypothetical protein
MKPEKSINHPNEECPPGEKRLQVPRVFFQPTVEQVNEHVQHHTVEPVLGLVEVGISDWEDRKTRNVIVLVTIGFHFP